MSEVNSTGMMEHLHCLGQWGYADGWYGTPGVCASCTVEAECKQRAASAGVEHQNSVVAGQSARLEGPQTSMADPRSASGRPVGMR